MRKVFLVITITLALPISGNLLAQTQNVPEGSKKTSRSAAVDINNSEIEMLVRKMAADAVGDQAIRIVSVNDEYNLAIGIVSRLNTAPQRLLLLSSTATSLRFITSSPAAVHWSPEVCSKIQRKFLRTTKRSRS